MELIRFHLLEQTGIVVIKIRTQIHLFSVVIARLILVDITGFATFTYLCGIVGSTIEG